jgi:hypothetical protein
MPSIELDDPWISLLAEAWRKSVFTGVVPQSRVFEIDTDLEGDTMSLLLSPRLNQSKRPTPMVAWFKVTGTSNSRLTCPPKSALLTHCALA